MVLRLFGAEPTSVYGILGTDENSATFALGWVLDRSPAFAAALVNDLLGIRGIEHENLVIELQRHGSDRGFTDIEIICRNKYHIIIEAKRGWTLPSDIQLQKYSRRLSKDGQCGATIVSMSAASGEYATNRLPKEVLGIPLVHRSWADVRQIALEAHRTTRSFEQKLWIRELAEHLKEYVSLRNSRDNLVYVVSLSNREIRDGGGYTWIDVVEKDERYFHPVGNHWPVLPPNYIAFRYYGQLQSVHHIKDYKVVTDLSSLKARWPDTESDHFVYQLGPA
ncbi:MAG: hypothetical protein ACE1ZA_19600, partial [Pseudomonadales bacterium]